MPDPSVPHKASHQSMIDRCMAIVHAAEEIDDIAGRVQDQTEVVRTTELRLLEELAGALAANFEQLDIVEIEAREAVPRKGLAGSRLLRDHIGPRWARRRCKILAARIRDDSIRGTYAAVGLTPDGRLHAIGRWKLFRSPACRGQIMSASHVVMAPTHGSLPIEPDDRLWGAYDLEAADALGIEPSEVLAAAEQALRQALLGLEQRHTRISERARALGI